MVATALVVAAASYAEVPYTFRNGSIADADEVNANFNALDARVAALEASVTTLQTDVATNTSDISTVQSDVTALQTGVANSTPIGINGSGIAALNATFAGVTRGGTPDTLTFPGMNVQVVSGSGSTTAAVNGLGNLIVGYNENNISATRTGSHNLVLGIDHEYTSYAGLVAGRQNRISGALASVSGGHGNEASGGDSSVSGGTSNKAGSNGSSVVGDSGNVYVDGTADHRLAKRRRESPVATAALGHARECLRGRREHLRRSANADRRLDEAANRIG